MADLTFEVSRARALRVEVPTVLFAVIGLGLVVRGVVVGDGAMQPLPLVWLGAGVWAVFDIVVWRLHRVRLEDTAVVLEGRLFRRVRIPYVHLESVAPGRWDAARRGLVWRRRYDPPVNTLRDVDDLGRMLVELARRAPDAEVDGW